MSLSQVRSTLARLTLLAWVALFVGQSILSCQERVPVRAPIVVVPPPRTGFPRIVLVAPESEQVTTLTRTLRSELGADFDVADVTISPQTTSNELKRILAELAPRATVLVDNSAVQLYAPIAEASKNPLPSLIVMASFAEELQRRTPNSMAIAFETPVVTTLSDLRALLGRPLARAGVVYRAGFESFVNRERERAARSQIELVLVRVPSAPSVGSLSRALRKLERAHLDAVWISNDNVLLTRRLLGRAWIPFEKKTGLPIVVGVPGLVRSPIPFATYAAVPDPVGLGVQAADLIFSLRDSDFRVTTPGVQPPIAVKTYLNAERGRSLGMPPESETRVDVLLHPGGPNP